MAKSKKQSQKKGTKLSSKIVSKKRSQRPSKKVKLDLAKFNFVEIYDIKRPGISLLSLLNLVIIAILPLLVINQIFERSRLDIWVTLIAFLMLVRIIATLFYGFKLWPSVKFDLPMLTMVTLILVVTILQTNEGLVSLGGTNIWGVGVLMLSLASIYLFLIFSRRTFRLRLLLQVLLAAMTLVFVSYNLGDDVYRNLVSSSFANILGLLALIMFVVSLVSFLYFKKSWARVFPILLLINSIGLIFNNFDWLSLFVVVLSMLVFGAIVIFIQETEKGQRRLTLKYLKKDLQNYRDEKIDLQKFMLRHLGFINLLCSIILMIGFTLVIIFKLDPRVGQTLSEFIVSYVDVFESFGGLQEWVLGKGLSEFGTTVRILLVSYGLIGVIAFMIFLINILRTIWQVLVKLNQQVNYRFRLFGYSFVFVVFVIFVAAFFGQFTVGMLFVELILLSIIYALHERLYKDTGAEAQKILQLKILDFSQVSELKFLTRIMSSEIWMEVFQTFRILVAIVLVVYTPIIIGYLVELI